MKETNRRLMISLVTLFVLVTGFLSFKRIDADAVDCTLTYSTDISDVTDVVAENKGLVVDLYQIASFTQNGDSFVFTPGEEFKSLFNNKTDFMKMDSDQLDEFANSCSKIVFNGSFTPDKAKIGQNTLLSDKLYLAIVRNDNTDKENYLKIEDDKYSSVFSTKKNSYYFKPLLVFTQGADLQVDLNKYTKQNGELVIEKVLKTYAGKPVTFVFEVDLIKDNQEVQFDVVSLTFNSYGVKQTIVKNIPVGSKVKIKEIYAGSSYKVSGDSSIIEKDIQCSADKKGESGYIETKATFENDFNDDSKKGYGVLNTFNSVKSADKIIWEFRDNDLGGTNNE